MVNKTREKLKKQRGKKLHVKYLNGSWRVHEYRAWWDSQKKRSWRISKYMGIIPCERFHRKERNKTSKKKEETERENQKQ